jgi:predicted RNase H-like nuclease (RuvC/YqgF family)
MAEFNQNKYNILYAQRLETLFHEQIRKTIDVEVRLSLSYELLEEEKNRYFESQKQVEIQNDMMQQASNSIQELTINNKNNDNITSILNNRISELETLINKTTETNSSYQAANNQKDSRIKELERELERQSQELQTTFNELQKVKQLIPPPVVEEPKKIINKSKKSVEVFTEDGTF